MIGRQIEHKINLGEFSSELKQYVKESIKKYNVQSIKRFNTKYVGYADTYIGNQVIENMINANPYIHLVISENQYLMEKLLGIDIIKIIRGCHSGMKITIKWIK